MGLSAGEEGGRTPAEPLCQGASRPNTTIGPTPACTVINAPCHSQSFTITTPECDCHVNTGESGLARRGAECHGLSKVLVLVAILGTEHAGRGAGDCSWWVAAASRVDDGAYVTLPSPREAGFRGAALGLLLSMCGCLSHEGWVTGGGFEECGRGVWWR